MKKILILGGGFAGVDAATHLRKLNYDVTLVSNRDYFYIYPTSIWIPTHEIGFKDTCIDLNELQKAHGFNLIIDGVNKISKENNSVTLQSGKIINDYDYLIIAIGASKMKPKGVENTFSICGAPEQSLAIRDALDDLVKKGSGKIAMGFGGNPKDTSAVRGGPGFELLFNVHNMLKKKGIRDKFELTFFAPMAEPGKRMGPNALKMMATMFSKLKIKQHFGKKITHFEKDGVVFEDESKLDADLVMFIPAGDGHEIIKESDLSTNDAGFIKTDDYSCVLNEDGSLSNIYAIGDVASLEGYDWRAKQGHVAEVMAKNAAHNIHQREQNKTNFKGYNEHLNILCVMDTGNGAAFVYRDEKKAFMLPMPIFGHWLKKAWGVYCRNTKLGKIPRIPGM
ncbi:FAD-dependent pyridine nucleotide-disulfide oxidoreductase [Arcobacter nitrofigilis DSM 7299]|uniref:FAD-dependent pyridine nucleotide-disulfide oxidoreductase n=1 Tax=Arcobacter nitrofigilis (strain ATCC 33309 / DSM 7299 / CCUG 15893 / LMG 7604 / NCTC 12251 / CI) TaxID=572480 RepID=D5V182_ARCNC|nr:FAD-dependent oxidoreductase [Arcobacter nitrofigilis]ADG94044.1 FAD-dependent pyridine nucleotide-disulfide oxidoreductase [Arcobacter nitrofigilis DSM 7299]